MPRTVPRALLFTGLVAVLAMPAGASAAVTVTESCGFFGCNPTVTALGSADSISVQDNPDNAGYVQFTATGNSAIDPWDTSGIGGSGCSQVLASGTRTIKCTRSGIFVTIDGGGGDDNLSSSKNAYVALNGEGGNDSLSVPAAPLPGVLRGGSGDDTLTGDVNGDELDGGGGRDNLYANAGDDTITGGDGDDTIQGGDGVDTIDGGAGRDIITPGLGADDTRGGDGFDAVAYTDRNDAVTVTLDDSANDGVASEGDNIHADVEDLIGGKGGDTLSGNDSGNVIEGRGGNDSITGGGGQDALLGGDGDDTLRARDGARENLDCGAGTDSVIGDQVDVLTDCESQDLSADLVPDFDGDGVTKPSDCNDSNAAIRPGAAEVPDNGVDENCDGADAVDLDRDGDGSVRPQDCNDASATVKPGAAEKPGNAVDEDCSGLADPYPRITSTVLNGFTAFSGYTRVDTLKVRGVPRGATVKVTCSGGGCPKKGFSRKLSRTTRLLDVRGPYRSARLRSGARLELRITLSGRIGRVVRFTMRRGAFPRAQSLCLPPGKTKPAAC